MDIIIILILQQLPDVVCDEGINAGVFDVVLYEACVSKFLVRTFLSLFLWPRPSPLAQGLQVWYIMPLVIFFITNNTMA
jgi:hypothetical protein